MAASKEQRQSIEWKMRQIMRILETCTAEERTQLLAAVAGLYATRKGES